MPRKDLEGRLPVVYNGRSVEEWYSMYCHEASTHNTTKYQLAQAKRELESLRARLNGARSVRDIQGDDCVSVW